MSILTSSNLRTRVSNFITLYGSNVSVWSIGGTYDNRGEITETVGGTKTLRILLYPRTTEERMLEREGNLLRSEHNALTVGGTTLKTNDEVSYMGDTYKVTDFGTYGLGANEIAFRFGIVKEADN